MPTALQLFAALLALLAQANDGGPFQATGFKIGEVSPTSVIVWTRLTERRRAPIPPTARESRLNTTAKMPPPPAATAR